jgi:hypothetical protein
MYETSDISRAVREMEACWPSGVGSRGRALNHPLWQALNRVGGAGFQTGLDAWLLVVENGGTDIRRPARTHLLVARGIGGLCRLHRPQGARCKRFVEERTLEAAGEYGGWSGTAANASSGLLRSPGRKGKGASVDTARRIEGASRDERGFVAADRARSSTVPRRRTMRACWPAFLGDRAAGADRAW